MSVGMEGSMSRRLQSSKKSLWRRWGLPSSRSGYGLTLAGLTVAAVLVWQSARPLVEGREFPVSAQTIAIEFVAATVLTFAGFVLMVCSVDPLAEE